MYEADMFLHCSLKGLKCKPGRNRADGQIKPIWELIEGGVNSHAFYLFICWVYRVELSAIA